MPILKNIPLTLNDFTSANWEELIAANLGYSCEDYYKIFFEKAREAEERLDEKAQEVYTLLGAVSSMQLNPDSDTVFTPFFIWHSPPMRGFTVDDLAPQHLSVLAELAPNVHDPDLRARIADVLWVKGKGKFFNMVALASTSYLDAAIRILTANSNIRLAVDRLERSLQLAVLTRQAELQEQCIERFYTLLQTPHQEKLSLILNLMKVFNRYRRHDPSRSLPLVQQAVKDAHQLNNWFLKIALLDILSALYAMQGDIENQRNILTEIAETHVKIAVYYAESPTPNYAAATFELKRAIEAYRNMGGMQARSNELHKILLEYQSLSTGDMHHVSVDVDHDVTIQIQQWYREQVQGIPFNEALQQLAFSIEVNKISDLRDQVELYRREFLYVSLFAHSIVDEHGRTVATAPSMMSNDPEEVEKAIRVQMYKEAILRQGYKAFVAVLPMLDQIYSEHEIRVRDLHFIVQNNPFIPPGHEALYVQGLYYGLIKDYMIAIHLLLPQLECSIRYILNQRGIVTSSLNTLTGIQEEYRLQALLSMEETKAILGEDLIFDLQGLLIERFGSNLRNKVFHGLMPSDAFYSLDMVYAWWLVLRLCFHGINSSREANN